MIPYLFKANQTNFDAGFIGRFENALSCNVTEELNGAFELNMTVLNNDPNLENMAIGSIIVAKPNQTQGNQPFVVEQLVKKIDGTIDVYAVHMSQHRAKLIPISPFTASSLADTITSISANAQETNPFTITTDKAVAATLTFDIPKTLRDLMGGSEGSILDVYGGEWFYSNFNLMLMNRRGRTDSNLKVLYGSNMTEYVETDEFNWSTSYTGILPYYKNEETVVIGDIQYSNHADEYPYKKTIVYDFSTSFADSVPTKAQLNAKAVQFLNGKGTIHVSIEVSFEDLSKLPMYNNLYQDSGSIQLGDTVEIINSAYNTQFKSRVRTLDYDVLLERYNTIKIGDQTGTINDAIGEMIPDGNVDLSTKMNLVLSPTANDILVTDSNGQAVDGGKTLNDLQDKLTAGAGINITSGSVISNRFTNLTGVDLNTVKYNCLVWCNDACTNLPKNYGGLLLSCFSSNNSNYGVQLFASYATSGRGFWYRRFTGGTWYDWQEVYTEQKIQRGSITSGTLAASSNTSLTITFDQAFATAPHVSAVAYPYSSYDDRYFAISTVSSISTTGATIVVHNPYTSDISLSASRRIEWIAIG